MVKPMQGLNATRKLVSKRKTETKTSQRRDQRAVHLEAEGQAGKEQSPKRRENFTYCVVSKWISAKLQPKGGQGRAAQLFSEAVVSVEEP